MMVRDKSSNTPLHGKNIPGGMLHQLTFLYIQKKKRGKKAPLEKKSNLVIIIILLLSCWQQWSEYLPSPHVTIQSMICWRVCLCNQRAPQSPTLQTNKCPVQNLTGSTRRMNVIGARSPAWPCSLWPWPGRLRRRKVPDYRHREMVGLLLGKD